MKIDIIIDLIDRYKKELKEHEKILKESIPTTERYIAQLACINVIENFIEDLEELKKYYRYE